MISNRNLLLLFLLLTAAASAVYFGWYREQDEPVTLYERSFATRDTSAIATIFMANKSGQKIKLSRKGTRWILNDSIPARPVPVGYLLEALQEMDVKYVPTKASIKNIVKDLAVNGVKTELYDAQGKKIKTLYIGGTSGDGLGTYAIMEGAENPYVLEMPGFIGNLGTRFFLAKNEWMDRTVFSMEIDSIREVIVEYPGQRNASFKLTSSNGKYEVVPLFPITPVISRPLIKGNVEAFLYGFESQVAEAIVNGAPETQNIEKKSPFSVIQVTTAAGEKRAVKLYPLPGSPVVEKDESMMGNDKVERYHAVSNWGNIYLVQTLNFKKILWGYPFFFEKMAAGADQLRN